MMATPFDATLFLYRLFRASQLPLMVTGGVYSQGVAPAASDKEDIEVGTIDLGMLRRPQTGRGNVNIYVPDIKSNIGGRWQKSPDLPRIKELADAALNVLRTAEIPGASITVESANQVEDPTNERHGVNIRVAWYIVELPPIEVYI